MVSYCHNVDVHQRRHGKCVVTGGDHWSCYDGSDFVTSHKNEVLCCAVMREYICMN